MFPLTGCQEEAPRAIPHSALSKVLETGGLAMVALKQLFSPLEPFCPFLTQDTVTP